MNRILTFIKNEIVFSIACLLAVISMFFVTPSSNYINYIDFRTLALLLALMLVVQGLKSCGLFDIMVIKLLKKARNRRQLAMALVLLCFFTSMLITNDVTLITFVPFTIMLLGSISEPSYGIYLIVLETIAANLGSMLTPIGSPHNLYMYSVSNIEINEFIMLMLPYTALSLIMLIVSVIVIKPTSIVSVPVSAKHVPTFSTIVYIIQFLVCISTVLHFLDYKIMLGIVLITIAIANRRLLFKADYILLLTFIAFFIFIGNIKHIPEISNMLSSVLDGRECVISVASSQLISNVPAAMLLSGFTDNYKALIIGVNIGGLGTLIASMASLISFKFYMKSKNCNVKRYITVFTVMNVLFLVVLLAKYLI